MDAHKNRSQEKLSIIKSFSLINGKLVIGKRLVNNQNKIIKKKNKK